MNRRGSLSLPRVFCLSPPWLSRGLLFWSPRSHFATAWCDGVGAGDAGAGDAGAGDAGAACTRISGVDELHGGFSLQLGSQVKHVDRGGGAPPQLQTDAQELLEALREDEVCQICCNAMAERKRIKRLAILGGFADV